MAGGQKKRPFPERHRRVRCPSVIYFAYLVKKFNLKILASSGPGASWPKSCHPPGLPWVVGACFEKFL